jgi:hypothetical protein
MEEKLVMQKFTKDSEDEEERMIHEFITNLQDVTTDFIEKHRPGCEIDWLMFNVIRVSVINYAGKTLAQLSRVLDEIEDKKMLCSDSVLILKEHFEREICNEDEDLFILENRLLFNQIW